MRRRPNRSSSAPNDAGRARRLVLIGAAALGLAVAAAGQGQASGALTVDGMSTALTHVVRTTTPNAFDETAHDPVIVLSNRPLTAEEAADRPGLAARAARGELVAVAVRYDGRPGRNRLFNVALSLAGQPEPVLLPDVWFTSAVTGAGGTVTMASREFQGRTYAVEATFAVPVFDATNLRAARPTDAPLPPPSRTPADRKAATALLIDALREGDERRALAIIERGVDPNGADDKLGIPVIAWAVIMCQPPVVKALVELDAEVRLERLPGMTLLDEARAACPDAVPFLRAGGAG